MNEINIAATLAHRRRERGLTQEEVAAHLGVSKASVSQMGDGTELSRYHAAAQISCLFWGEHR